MSQPHVIVLILNPPLKADRLVRVPRTVAHKMDGTRGAVRTNPYMQPACDKVCDREGERERERERERRDERGRGGDSKLDAEGRRDSI